MSTRPHKLSCLSIYIKSCCKVPLSIHHSVMEQKTTMYVSLFCSIFFIIFVLLKLRRKASTNEPNYPPSPPKFPFIGNLHNLGSLPHRSLTCLSQKYGPLMLLQLGQTPTLVVSSAHYAREIVKSHDITFSDRPQTTAAKILLYGCTDVGFLPYGEEWRIKRKIYVLQLLSLKRVHSFQYIREEEVGDLVNKIRQACTSHKNDCFSINVSKLIIAASNNISSRCLFGQKFETTADGKRSFGEVARKVMALMTCFSFGNFFPSLGWMDVVTGLIPKLNGAFRELDDFFSEVLAQHKSARINENDDDHKSEKKDFIDILHQLQQDDNVDFQLTQADIKAMIVVCLLFSKFK